jgi:hypothetical protein
VLTRYHQESRLSLQPHPQLRRLSFSDADPPLQSPPSVAWYIVVVHGGKVVVVVVVITVEDRAGLYSDLHRLVTIATSQTSRSQSLPRIPSSSPLLSSAAASRAMLSAASLSLLRWSLSRMLDCFGAGLRRVAALSERGAVRT